MPRKPRLHYTDELKSSDQARREKRLKSASHVHA